MDLGNGITTNRRAFLRIGAMSGLAAAAAACAPAASAPPAAPSAPAREPWRQEWDDLAAAVSPNDLKTVEDLLNPKWRGKIISGDPRSSGYGSTPGTSLRLTYGDDIIKRLWKDQEVVLTVDPRLLTESLVRGRYPISIGLDPSILNTFQQEGLGKNVRPLSIPNMQSVSASQDVVYSFKTKAHPNAAKLFVNWYLTKEGQTIWAEAGVNNSRRMDVEPLAPDRAPKPGVKYFSSESAEGIAGLAETYKIAQGYLT